MVNITVQGTDYFGTARVDVFKRAADNLSDTVSIKITTVYQIVNGYSRPLVDLELSVLWSHNAKGPRGFFVVLNALF